MRKSINTLRCAALAFAVSACERLNNEVSHARQATAQEIQDTAQSPDTSAQTQPEEDDSGLTEAMLNGTSPARLAPHDVPFTSEYDVKDSEWRVRACSPAAVYMVLSWAAQKDTSINAPRNIDAFIEDALAGGAHSPRHSWTHEGLAQTAASYGASAKGVW